jgi:hypothetical protein
LQSGRAASGGRSLVSSANSTRLRILRLILISLVPGPLAFSYVWTVDGGGDILTCIPRVLAGVIAGLTQVDVLLLRRVLIPGYLLVFVVPLVAYALKPKAGCLQGLGILGVIHLVFVAGIMLQDD